MNLSRTERWILSNQYRILALIDKHNASSHEAAQEVLDSGYESHYDWICEHVLDGDHVLTREESGYVHDVLDMHDALQFAYDKLEDKTGIQDTFITFTGFDGNNEGKFLGYVRFLRKDGRSYQTLRSMTESLDSHMPTDQFYPPMICAWNESSDKRRLTKADIIRITGAIRPDDR